MIPEALNLRELKSRCEGDDDDELTTLSDDDDAFTLHCNVNQLVSKRYTSSSHHSLGT